jgi:hypothetical protein
MLIGAILLMAGCFSELLVVGLLGMGFTGILGFAYPFIWRCSYCKSLRASGNISENRHVAFHCPDCGLGLRQK